MGRQRQRNRRNRNRATPSRKRIGGGSLEASSEIATQADEGGSSAASAENSDSLVVANDKGYSTLEEAFAAAEPDNDGVIKYEINGKAEVTSSGWVQVLKTGLTNAKKVEFVGNADNAEICITQGVAILADRGNDVDVSFEGLKLTKLNPVWAQDYGHGTNYFTTWLSNTDAANNTVTYTNCEFPNGVCNNQYGKTIFNECTFSNATAGLYNLWVYGGEVQIEGGSFTGVRGVKAYTEGTKPSISLNINGASFTGLTEKAAVVVSKAANVSFKNVNVSECEKGILQDDLSANKATIEPNGTAISGEFGVTADAHDFNITAGTFTGEVPSDYMAPGYELSKNESGSYSATKTKVAQVGENQFTDLQQAIESANDGDTVTLLGDTDLADTAFVQDKAITLDLGGHRLFNTNDIWDKSPNSWSLLSVRGNGSLTIDGNGTLQAKENDCYAVDVQDGATCTLNSGTFVGNIHAVYVQQGKAIVNGGSYSIQQTYPTAGKEYEFVLNCYDANRKAGTASIEVNGGTFSKFNPSNCYAEGAGTDFVSAGKAVKDNGNETYTVVDAVAQVAADGDSAYYASLNEAVSSCQDGAIVKLLADADITNGGYLTIDKAMTLNLNGFKIKAANNTKGYVVVKSNGDLTLIDSSEAKTGELYSESTYSNGANNAPLVSVYGGSFTMKSGTIDAASRISDPANNGNFAVGFYYYNSSAPRITIEGGHIKAGWYCLAGSGHSDYNGENATSNISVVGGVLESVADYAIYLPQKGVTTISDGVVYGAAGGVMLNRGILNVTGGTITSKGTGSTGNWGDGTGNASAAAINVNARYGDTSAVISGGKISAEKNALLLTTGSSHAATISASGGMFSSEVPSDYCAKGYECVPASVGGYIVAKTGSESKDDNNKTSGSVATDGVTVDADQQTQVAESAADAADSLKNGKSADDNKIGDFTVDTTGKTDEVAKVKEAAAQADSSVDVKLVVKADTNVVTNDKIEEIAQASDAAVVPFTLSVDMVTEVTSSDGSVSSVTVPVTETADPITVTIKVDPDSIQGKKVVVARVHNGVVTTITPLSVNEETGEIVFQTDRFSDYAVLTTDTQATVDLSDYTNTDGSRKSVDGVKFGYGSDYAFAGWYKDSGFKTPYTASDNNGTAYPKFVQVSDLIEYMGGSLRMDGPAASVSTSLRFGYMTSVPSGAKYVKSYWTWNDGTTEQEPVNADNRILFANGKAVANLVVEDLPKEYYSVAFFVTEHLQYTTVDGTSVAVAEPTPNSHSVFSVAEAITSYDGASPEELEYANEILDERNK